jgi:hypothetical protein
MPFIEAPRASQLPQDSVIGSYPEPDKFSPLPHIVINIHFNIIPQYSLYLPTGFFVSGLSTKILCGFISFMKVTC